MHFTRFKPILGILAAFFALVSCEAVSIQANLNVTPKTVTAPPEGGTYTVAFTAVAAWETSVAADWIHLSPASGESGDITLTITVDPNPGTEPRSAGVQVSSPELKVTETVAVSQEGKPAPPAATLSLSEESSRRPYTEGSAVITVNTNRDWTATSDADWLTPSPASGGAGQTQVTLTALENNTDLARSAVVTFKAEDLVKTYTLTQEPRPAAAITLSAPSQLFVAEGGEYTMIVNSNRAWTSACDSQWVTITPASGEAGSQVITVKAAANTDYQNRTATVEFTAGDSRATLVITQLAAQKDPDPYVRVSSQELTVPAAGGTLGIIVTSNQAWSASASESWVAPDPAQGIAGMTEVSIEVAANTTDRDRVANITFAAGNSTASVSVFQKARVESTDPENPDNPVEDPMLELSTKSITLPAEASQASFTIMTNRSWTVSLQSDWIRLDKTSGEAGSAQVKIMAEANPSEIERSVRVIVANEAGLTAALVITQEGKEPEKLPQVSFSVLSISFTEEGGSGEVTVISDTPWSASCSANWVSFTPKSGDAGTTTVKVTTQANNTSSDRTAEIIFTAGETTARFTINQKAKGQDGMGGITGDVQPWDNGGEADFHQE
ncbi:MAG: BACON domain-containing protein [Bacteroidales bacterium]|nr:BACON domain-containing protein [Bacteroidales bacterium]